MAAHQIEISIPNWEKYNPRNDRKSHVWFRLQNTFFSDQNVFDLANASKLTFIFLICEASKSNAGTFFLSINYASKMLGFSDKEFISVVNSLCDCGLVVTTATPTGNQSVATGNQSVATGSPTDRQTDRQTKESSGVETPAEPLPKIAKIWNQLKHNAMPQVRACGSSRKRHAELRWKENPCENFWTEVITRIGDSDFCRGKNQRAWIADFDFLIRPETAHKVLEGKYDNPKTHSEVHPALRGN